MVYKVEIGDKIVQDYCVYYDMGYKIDVYSIVIYGDQVIFYKGDDMVIGIYCVDGYKILIYVKGNCGVCFIFCKIVGDVEVLVFIQFSDYGIVLGKVWYFYIYWGDDSDVLLNELINWLIYYFV